MTSSIAHTTKGIQATNTQDTMITTKANQDTSSRGGIANKHNITHQFCSDVDKDSRDNALASDAVEAKLHKFKPIAYAGLSDMRYEDPEGTGSPSWTYTDQTDSRRSLSNSAAY